MKRDFLIATEPTLIEAWGVHGDTVDEPDAGS